MREKVEKYQTDSKEVQDLASLTNEAAILCSQVLEKSRQIVANADVLRLELGVVLNRN